MEKLFSITENNFAIKINGYVISISNNYGCFCDNRFKPENDGESETVEVMVYHYDEIALTEKEYTEFGVDIHGILGHATPEEVANLIHKVSNFKN
jgi:hypothetical protein